MTYNPDRSRALKPAEVAACVAHGEALGLSERVALAVIAAYTTRCHDRGVRANGNTARELLLEQAMRTR